MYVLNCITEIVPQEELVFVSGSPTIYFPELAKRKMSSGRDPMKTIEITHMLESYNISEARDEILGMQIEYVFIHSKPTGLLFRELDNVEEICSSGEYYLFRIND